jgi:hypothetical protein
MLSAMTAGCMSTMVTNPLWVIKTRIMVNINVYLLNFYKFNAAF